LVVAVCALIAILVFGTRDAWVSFFGTNGSVAAGIVIVVVALLPIATAVGVFAAGFRKQDDAGRALQRSVVLFLLVGVPAVAVLVAGAAY